MRYRFDVLDKQICYQGFFRIVRYRLRHELFAGGFSGDVVREVFERGDAVAVLLYDPELDAVVMVEQFRAGAVEHDGDTWLLEVVAGVVEEGEDTESVARRESLEEANCEIHDLSPMIEFYGSPGGCSEKTALYSARVDARHLGGIHGLDDENEDIRVHVVPVDEALRQLDQGQIKTAPAVIALQWLALNRERLKANWRVPAD